jgi:hypothetical protein
MSTVKSPPEKKQLSLVGDRRNLYGECPTSSREDIRRGKQRSHKVLRRAASQQRFRLSGSAEDILLHETEARAKSNIIIAKRSSFKNRPDTPPGEAPGWKAKWRSQRSGSK